MTHRNADRPKQPVAGRRTPAAAVLPAGLSGADPAGDVDPGSAATAGSWTVDTRRRGADAAATLIWATPGRGVNTATGHQPDNGQPPTRGYPVRDGRV